MLVMGFDLETTGLNVAEDRILEIGAILYDTDAKQPVRIYDTFVRPAAQLPADYVSPTGIKGEWLIQHGVSLSEALGKVQSLLSVMPEPILVGHNIINYDRPLALAEIERENIIGHGLKNAHVIDTRQDLPFDPEPSSRKLKHLLVDYAHSMNPYEHRALFDAAACFKLIDLFPFDEVLALSKIPLITVRALVTYKMEKERQGAKELRYAWNGEEKLWTKQVRENAWDREKAAAAEKGFEIVRI